MPSPVSRHQHSEIGRIVQRLVQGSVVPFVGAGFSYGAGDGKGIQTWSDVMPTILKRALDGIFNAHLSGNAPALSTLEKVRSQGEKSQSLGQLAELAHLLLGAREVCERLKIAGYADLLPQPCHRYLV